MKKIKWLVGIATILLLSLGITACKNPTPSTPEKPTPTVTLSAETGRIDVFETLLLTATTNNTESSVVWSTSNDAVATVSDGLVTGVSEGQAIVTAAAGEAKATCAITVYNSYTAPVLKVDYENIAVAKDGSFSVNLTTLWKGQPVDETVTYHWSLGDGADETVAEIAASGSSATFTGKNYGQVEYFVSATVRGIDLVKKVTVKVCNADILFEVSNLEQGNSVYVANLGLVSTTKGDVNEITPAVSVYNKGVLVSDASITWTSDNDAIVTVDTNGKITAVSKGEAEVRGSYENNDVVIRVNVYAPVIKLNETETVDVELYGSGNKNITLSADNKEDLRGDFVSVAVKDGDTLNDCSYNNGVIMLSGIDNLKGETEFVATFEEKQSNVVVCSTTVNFKATVITRIISDKATLDEVFHPNGGVTQDALNGYYVLSDNIDYSDTWGAIGTWVGSAFSVQFAGTWDGRGHYIKGVQVNSTDSGLFAGVSASGEIKNIAFTNAKLGGDGSGKSYGGFISMRFYGTLSDVYWQGTVERVGIGWENGGYRSAPLVMFNYGTVKNCFTDVTVGDNVQYGCGAIGVNANGGTSSNVYAVGLVNNDSAVTGYTSFAELAQSVEFTLDGWNTDMWRLLGQMPLPTCITVEAVVSITNTESDVSQSVSLPITVTNEKYAVLSLKNPTVGVTLTGSTLTIGANVAIGTKITVVAKSVYSDTAVEKTFTVIGGQTLNETTVTEVEIYGTSNKTVTLSESNKNALRGNLASVTVKDGVTLSGCIYNNGVITLSGIDGLKGETEFVATFEEKDSDNTVIYVTTVNFKALVITRIISDKAALDEVFHPNGGVTQDALNGYYVLSDNIEYNAIWTTIGTWAGSDFDVKFAGTLDGRGHYVKGVTVQSNSDCGLFARVDASGVIKNIAFTDATLGGGGKNAQKGGFIATRFYGTLSNIYWQGTIDQIGVNWGTTQSTSAPLAFTNYGKIENCFTDVTVGEDVVRVAGAVGENAGGTITNVCTVGYVNNDSAVPGYKDFTDLLAADVNFTSWVNDFWRLVNGIPYPKNLAIPTIDTTATLSDTNVCVGGEIKVTIDKHAVISSNTVGVTYSDGTLSVPNDLAVGSTLKITVTSVYDSTQSTEYTLTVVAADITVTGSYDFADGLEVDDSVTVFIGNVEATVDTTRKMFSAMVSAGTYTVTISCDKYATVTKEVTVSEENHTVEKMNFTLVKMSNYNGVTQNNDDSLTFVNGTWRTFVGAQTNEENGHAFAMQAHVEHNFGENNSAGLYFYVDAQHSYIVTLIVNSDRSVIMEISSRGEWSRVKPTISYTLPASCTSANYDVGYDLGLIYDGNGNYKVIVEGTVVYEFDYTKVVNNGVASDQHWKWDGLKDTAGARTLGLSTRDNGAARFSNVKYTFDENKFDTYTTDTTPTAQNE